jgi:hypothetical protein
MGDLIYHVTQSATVLENSNLSGLEQADVLTLPVIVGVADTVRRREKCVA